MHSSREKGCAGGETYPKRKGVEGRGGESPEIASIGLDIEGLSLSPLVGDRFGENVKIISYLHIKGLCQKNFYVCLCHIVHNLVQ